MTWPDIHDLLYPKYNSCVCLQFRHNSLVLLSRCIPYTLFVVSLWLNKRKEGCPESWYMTWVG